MEVVHPHHAKAELIRAILTDERIRQRNWEGVWDVSATLDGERHGDGSTVLLLNEAAQDESLDDLFGRVLGGEADGCSLHRRVGDLLDGRQELDLIRVDRCSELELLILRVIVAVTLRDVERRDDLRPASRRRLGRRDELGTSSARLPLPLQRTRYGYRVGLKSWTLQYDLASRAANALTLVRQRMIVLCSCQWIIQQSLSKLATSCLPHTWRFQAHFVASGQRFRRGSACTCTFASSFGAIVCFVR